MTSMQISSKMAVTEMKVQRVYPCCGDDPINGDCEPVGSAFSILPNGDVLFTSQRHRAKVLVARDKVLWMTLRGGEFSEAHWCGRRREELVQSELRVPPPTTLNPDPVFLTFCAIISPRECKSSLETTERQPVP